MNWFLKNAKKILRIAAGIIVLGAGLLLAIPGIPGPGLIVIFIGLSILAVDFVWAHRLKTKMKSQADKLVDKVRSTVKSNSKP
jgi:tellurite resistance protein TerC